MKERIRKILFSLSGVIIFIIVLVNIGLLATSIFAGDFGNDVYKAFLLHYHITWTVEIHWSGGVLFFVYISQSGTPYVSTTVRSNLKYFGIIFLLINLALLVKVYLAIFGYIDSFRQQSETEINYFILLVVANLLSDIFPFALVLEARTIQIVKQFLNKEA